MKISFRLPVYLFDNLSDFLYFSRNIFQQVVRERERKGSSVYTHTRLPCGLFVCIKKMEVVAKSNSKRMYSWWWDSHNTPKNSKWLQDNLAGTYLVNGIVLRFRELFIKKFNKYFSLINFGTCLCLYSFLQKIFVVCCKYFIQYALMFWPMKEHDCQERHQRLRTSALGVSHIVRDS